MTCQLVCIEGAKILMDPFRMTSIGGTWLSMAKHVRIRQCPACIKFTSTDPKHGPMQIRIYDCPFNTIGIDYAGQLPTTPTGNKWILTAVCPFSNFLQAIPVPDKQATTAAHALFNDVFLQHGLPAVLQSDQGGEWLNAVLPQLTKLLSTYCYN